MQLLKSGVMAGWSYRFEDPAWSAEDLAQEAIVRLLERPPADWDESPPDLARLRSWVKTTSARRGHDLAQQRKRRDLHAKTVKRDSWKLKGETALRPDEHFEAVVELERLRAHLANAYPAGAAVLELLLLEPHLSARELGDKLGISAASVHQIGSRLRATLRAAGWDLA